MNRRTLIKSVAAMGGALASGAAQTGKRLVPRVSPPPGMIEHIGLGINSVVALKDGSVLANNGSISRDGGKTWSAPRKFDGGAAGDGLVRLQSGAIALTKGPRLWISRDEGASWSPCPEAFPKMIGGPNFLGDELIQLKGGRLLWPCSIDFNPRFPELLYENVLAKGTWRGKTVLVEGHQHLPEIYMTFFGYSDDEGRSWKMVEGYYHSPLAMFGWFDEQGVPNGNGGHWSFGESTVAETSDGRVLIFGRSEVGRIVYSYSADRGITWNTLLAAELANSGSPPRLRRIPSTGDLLCVWNQVSHEEIRRGYRRGRLSAAISQDNGATWTNFRNLELSAGLEPADRVAPEYPIRMVRARDYVGHLPDAWAYFHYSNVCFVGDKVYVMYLRGAPLLGIAEQNLDKQEHVLSVYPLDWFYGRA
jgi:hypothetical protein